MSSMSVRFAGLFGAALALGVLVAPPRSAVAEDEKPVPATPAAKSASKEKNKPAPKLYRFKSHKQTGAGDAQVTVVSVEDMLSGRSETLYASSAEVTSAVTALAAGAPIEVETKREKGRQTIVSLAPAQLAPGEELNNHYVLVEWDKQKQADGTPIMGVKLRKFGREITAMIPLVKNKETDDWAANWNVEHVLGKVQPG